MKQTNYKLGLMVMAVAAVTFGSSYAMFNPETTTQDAQIEKTFINGHVDLVVRDGETGEVKAYRQSDNAITNDGMELIGLRMFGGNSTFTNAALGWIQIGTGSTIADGQDSIIETAISSCTRATTSAITNNSSASNATANIVVTATIDASGGNCNSSGITEAGLFNAAAAGEMFARNLFAPVTLGGTDTLDITWTFTLTDT